MDAKKRILIFSTAYLPFVGGAEIAVKEITDRIQDTQFVMITARLKSDLKEHEKIGNVEVYRIGKGNKWDKIRFIFQGFRKAQELGEFDLVWSIMASYAGFSALKYKEMHKNVPFLLTLQEGDSRSHIYRRVWWCWWRFKRIFSSADSISAISTYLAEWGKNMGAKGEVRVVPNGVDVGKFEDTRDKIQTNYKLQITNTLSIAENTKLIITISRLVKKNGVGDLIKAMSFLPEDYYLLVVGEGELEQELKELSSGLNLKERVHFLGGVEYDDLPKYLWSSDVFCRPSLSEGLGNVFLEAMAAGVPVVGTKVGGIPDFLQDGQTGLFCEVGNPKDIAEKIMNIVDDEDLKNTLTKNGSELVSETYSWDLVARKMKHMFEKII